MAYAKRNSFTITAAPVITPNARPPGSPLLVTPRPELLSCNTPPAENRPQQPMEDDGKAFQIEMRKIELRAKIALNNREIRRLDRLEASMYAENDGVNNESLSTPPFTPSESLTTMSARGAFPIASSHSGSAFPIASSRSDSAFPVPSSRSGSAFTILSSRSGSASLIPSSRSGKPRTDIAGLRAGATSGDLSWSERHRVFPDRWAVRETTKPDKKHISDSAPHGQQLTEALEGKDNKDSIEVSSNARSMMNAETENTDESANTNQLATANLEACIPPTEGSIDNNYHDGNAITTASDSGGESSKNSSKINKGSDNSNPVASMAGEESATPICEETAPTEITSNQSNEGRITQPVPHLPANTTRPTEGRVIYAAADTASATELITQPKRQSTTTNLLHRPPNSDTSSNRNTPSSVCGDAAPHHNSLHVKKGEAPKSRMTNPPVPPKRIPNRVAFSTNPIAETPWKTRPSRPSREVDLGNCPKPQGLSACSKPQQPVTGEYWNQVRPPERQYLLRLLEVVSHKRGVYWDPVRPPETLKEPSTLRRSKHTCINKLRPLTLHARSFSFVIIPPGNNRRECNGPTDVS